MGYPDHVGLIAPLPLIEAALPATTELHDIFGFVLKLSESEWGQLPEFLGLMVDLSLFPADGPRLFPSVAKRDRSKARVEEALGSGRASSARLQKLVGTVSFAQSSSMGTTIRPL